MDYETPIQGLAEIRARVSKLREQVGDDEGAHVEEDSIRRAALRAIAAGSPDAVAIAAAALETDEYEFSRWYA